APRVTPPPRGGGGGVASGAPPPASLSPPFSGPLEGVGWAPETTLLGGEAPTQQYSPPAVTDCSPTRTTNACSIAFLRLETNSLWRDVRASTSPLDVLKISACTRRGQVS